MIHGADRPPSMFIDYAMRHFTDHKMDYDKDGVWGKHGKVSPETVDSYLNEHPFFKHEPPKTTGRESSAKTELLL